MPAVVSRLSTASMFAFTLDVLIENSEDDTRLWRPRSSGYWLLNSIAAKGEALVIAPCRDPSNVRDPLYRDRVANALKQFAMTSRIRIAAVPWGSSDNAALAGVKGLAGLPATTRNRVRLAFVSSDTASASHIEDAQGLGINLCVVMPARSA